MKSVPDLSTVAHILRNVEIRSTAKLAPLEIICNGINAEIKAKCFTHKEKVK